MATFCCIYGLNDGEETIGSERVVGERKFAPREPYGARRTRFCGSTQSRWDHHLKKAPLRRLFCA